MITKLMGYSDNEAIQKAHDEIAISYFLQEYSLTPDSVKSVIASEGEAKALERLSKIILGVDLPVAAYEYVITGGFDNIDNGFSEISIKSSERFMRSIFFFDLYDAWYNEVDDIKCVLEKER